VLGTAFDRLAGLGKSIEAIDRGSGDRIAQFSVFNSVRSPISTTGGARRTLFRGDPNTSLIKLRQFGELLAQEIAARVGLLALSRSKSQAEIP
jgi:type I restriction enzyme, R subunit